MTEEQERELRRKLFWWRLVLQYGIGVVVIVFYVTASFHFQYTPDETYVYLQYGRNIARGDGVSFNAGIPSYGVAGPLWPLLIAGGTKLGLDPYIVAKTLDIVFASISVMAVLAFAFVLVRDRIYALVAAWIFSFDALFLRWSGSGMDASLGILIALLTVWYTYKKEYLTAALVCGLLTLVRLEGMIMFVVVLIDALLNARHRDVLGRTVIGAALLYAVVVGPWLVFSRFYFGTIAPDSFRPDLAAGLSSMWSSIVTDVTIVGATQVILVMGFLAGAIVTIRRFGWRVFREEGFPLLFLFVFPVACAVMDIRLASRDLLLVMPIVVVYGVWGVKRLEIASVVSPQRAFFILLIVAGLSLAQNQYLYRRLIEPHMDRVELGVNECLKPIAYWLRSHAPDGAKVLSPSIGVIGYISGKEIVDTDGLISPAVGNSLRPFGYDQGMMKKKYASVFDPDYVVDRSPIPERLASDSLEPIMTRSFSGIGLTQPGLVYYTLYKVIR